MNKDKITIVNAKENNLKSISVVIPRNQLTVITGPSGSGKSSLAFDTIYVEGQRRYIESLSSYARQFLGQFRPPDVESITGLSPTLAIDQKTTSKNPRSTVGTITEIYDYFRVLFARAGTPQCPQCGIVVESQSAQKIVNNVLKLPKNSKLMILAPVVKKRKGEHKDLLARYQTMGLARIRLNGEIFHISENIKIEKNKLNILDVVIDRIILKDGIEKRITDSIELALRLGSGEVIINVSESSQSVNSKDILFSENNSCPHCDISFPELAPRLFSFNSPLGACPDCKGLGETMDFSKDLIVHDPNLSIEEGALGPLNKRNSFFLNMINCMASAEKVDIKVPYGKLSKKFIKILFDGGQKSYTYSFISDNSTFNFTKPFPGIMSWLEKKYNGTDSQKTKEFLEAFMIIQECKACSGHKLNSFALNTKINNLSIFDYCQLSITETFHHINNLNLEGEKAQIAQKVLHEIKARLQFLLDVGLNYLTLNRSAMTLSGGENQRIRLATQIGSSLSGVLYVLDEPTIGLHSRDNDKLIKTIMGLKDLGNTIIIVEHDEEMIKSADFILDIGPGAGIHGGEIVAQGSLQKILKSPKSITGPYLSGKRTIPVPTETRTSDKKIRILGAKKNNLSLSEISLPLNSLVCITGVSGSGKSTLVHNILVPAIKAKILASHKNKIKNKNFDHIYGLEHIDSVIELDQSPIGRTPKSNPATYTGLFDEIRALFARTPDAKVRGYLAGRFSFNVKGGRCEECEGNGVKKIEMHFLPDVFITCSTCQGKRYNQETLSIYFKGKNIAEVLGMSIEEASQFFENHQKISRILTTFINVGLSYMTLGQSATTLSGGEAQRLKLSRELAKKSRGHCLYILDEPTTGLHFQDIQILLKAIHQLVDAGHSMIIIEHNLEVIKTADYIVDLGPEGGEQGGQIVASGTPREVAKNKKSYTGIYLKKYFKK